MAALFQEISMPRFPPPKPLRSPLLSWSERPLLRAARTGLHGAQAAMAEAAQSALLGAVLGSAWWLAKAVVAIRYGAGHSDAGRDYHACVAGLAQQLLPQTVAEWELENPGEDGADSDLWSAESAAAALAARMWSAWVDAQDQHWLAASWRHRWLPAWPGCRRSEVLVLPMAGALEERLVREASCQCEDPRAAVATFTRWLATGMPKMVQCYGWRVESSASDLRLTPNQRSA